MKRLIGLLLAAVMIVLPLSAQRADMKGLKFCIDPGHGGHSSNDRPPVFSELPFWESDGNYAKALLLKSMLEARGATVILTRYTNEYTNNASGGDDEPSLSARYTIANQNNVNWFHSIHSNATGGTNTGSNYTLILLKENTATRQAQWPEALVMSDKLWNHVQAKNRTQSTYWVRTDYTFYGGPNGGFNLGVLNGSAMPAELSEGSFHDYKPETRKLLNNDYRRGEAYGIYNAFCDYFGVTFDTLGIIAGTQSDRTTGLGVNGAKIRVLPINRTYTTDTYNNGYFLMDSIPAGTYTVRYETPGYPADEATVTITNNQPAIASTVPAANAMGVDRATPIVITFLKAMDTAFVRSKMTVTPSIDGVISWSAGNTVMTITPRKPLPFKTAYTFSFAGMAKAPTSTIFVDNGSVSSTFQSVPYLFSYTTIPLPPYISLTQPKANDTAFAVTKQIIMRFTDVMDTASARAAFSMTPNVPGTFTWKSDLTTMYFTPSAPLDGGTQYTVKVNGSAKSVYGSGLDANQDTVSGDAHVFSFRTVGAVTGVEKDETAPKEFALTQNYPNPFNPSTNFEVHVAEVGLVSVKVYDLLGREVSVLVNEKLAPGIYTYAMNASMLTSGVYFYRMQAGSFVQTKRMIVQK
ncbi:MAG: Ig-like domain-containing protein [Acidobacteriota bacterium]